jgi:hypothetical protein
VAALSAAHDPDVRFVPIREQHVVGPSKAHIVSPRVAKKVIRRCLSKPIGSIVLRVGSYPCQYTMTTTTILTMDQPQLVLFGTAAIVLLVVMFLT